MTAPRTFSQRFSSALLTAALLAAVVSLFLYSFDPVHAPAPEHESFITFAPAPRPPAPVTVIDARGALTRLKPPLSSAAPANPNAPSSMSATAPVTSAPPAPPAALQALQRRASDCTPDKLPGLSPEQRAACPPAIAPPANDVMKSPYQPKNQAHWDAEMERKKGQIIPETKGVTDGITAGVGTIGVTVSDPLCKLTVLIAGTGGCGAPEAIHIYNDDQVQAAMDAYHKRRGGGTAPAAAAQPAPQPAQ